MPNTSQFATWRLCMCLLLGCLPLLVSATHIVGGHLEMKAQNDKPGHFKISLIYFFDELQTWPAAPNALIVIYRKQDNLLMDSLRINNQTVNNRPLVIFANEACATTAKMKISMVRYEGEIQLNPATYNDPSGYYLAYQTCCRNGGVTNIQKPNKAGYVYYLEFPALIKNGKSITNSSPAFGTLNGEYICVNKPFTFNFNASDADGDQLRYSITTPLYGFQDSNGNPYIRPAPYPEVQWIAGYGPGNEIPGNPPLSINAQTGELSVTATKLGLFVFAIRIEEFRNGEKIGEVRRDYQFLVVDCPSATPPATAISIQNQPIGTTEATICEGKFTELQATANATWHYQWKFNGSNITGATTPTLSVSEPGEYSLETSLKDQCSQSQRSTKVTVKKSTPPQATVTGAVTTFCKGDSIALQGSNGVTYAWLLDGNKLPNATRSTFYAHQAGSYSVSVVDSAGCSAISQPVSLSTVNKISVTLDSLRPVCGSNNPAIPLKGYPSGGIFDGPGVTTSGTALFDPRKAGVGNHLITYTVKGASECQSGNASRHAVVAALPTILLPTELSTSKGGSVDLQPVLTSQPVRSQWQPTTYLTDPTQPVTQAINIENDISYTLQIENADGCRAEATIHVTIHQRIWIPDTFTPNGDGLNEVWELKGIEAYPQAELTIFDRWGQIIFHTNEGYKQPFNGTFNGQNLPDGAYSYTIRPTPEKAQSLNGVVMVIR